MRISIAIYQSVRSSVISQMCYYVVLTQNERLKYYKNCWNKDETQGVFLIVIVFLLLNNFYSDYFNIYNLLSWFSYCHKVIDNEIKNKEIINKNILSLIQLILSKLITTQSTTLRLKEIYSVKYNLIQMNPVRTPSLSITNGASKNKDQLKKCLPQDNNGKREVPRVEIFLDCHLSKAIQQIKISIKSKPTITKPINFIATEKKTELPDDRVIMEGQRQERVNAQYQQADRKWRQKIELMPNDVVLNYIKEVYQKYQIINPFEEYLDDEIAHDKTGHNQVNNNSQYQSNQKINRIQKTGGRVRKNWHSFSEQKQSQYGEQDNNGSNEHIYQYDDKFRTLKKLGLGQDKEKKFMNCNKKDTVKTNKKKLSQNQQRILQLKNKFKLIQSGQDKNTNQPSSATLANITNQQQQNQHQYPLPTKTHQKKQSLCSITYIDNLKNLIQSQLVDFGSTSRANGNSSERNKLLTMRFINSMGDVMGTMREGNMVDPPQGEGNPRLNHTHSAIRPKKRLFVKTIRGNSTKASIEGTPIGTVSGKSNKNMLDESSLMVVDTNSRGQTGLSNKNLLISNNVPQYYSCNAQTFPYRTSLTCSVATSTMYIPQHHRYCIGCQHPILDSNILYHEENCSEWRRIAQLSIQQLLSVVDNKLAKIRLKLRQNELFNLKIDDINQIQALGKSLLNDNLQQQQQRQQPTNKQLISKDHVDKIDKLLQKKVLRGCEMIKKLQWFIKLRTTLQQQLDLKANNQERQSETYNQQEKKISAFSLLQ